jgi:hypothetical protein
MVGLISRLFDTTETFILPSFAPCGYVSPVGAFAITCELTKA